MYTVTNLEILKTTKSVACKSFFTALQKLFAEFFKSPINMIIKKKKLFIYIHIWLGGVVRADLDLKKKLFEI